MPELSLVVVAVGDLVEQTQLEHWLTAAGFQVLLADNSGSLIHLAETHRPTVILLAENFAGEGSGQTLCRHLKAHPSTRAGAVVMIGGREQQRFPTPGSEGSADEVLVRPLLGPEVLVRMATMERLQRYANESVRGSKMDTLTGTFNHNHLVERLQHEVLRAARYGRCIALVVLDLDHFAELNIREGTTFGDLVLREVARALTSRLRGVDLVARSGSDEFSIVLPETSLLVARSVAERLRSAIESLGQIRIGDEERLVKLTASLGISGFPHPETTDASDLLRFARAALAQAREAGHNRSVLHRPTSH